jgi:3-oxoacyl-[acyl-carrier-protein] synthase III
MCASVSAQFGISAIAIHEPPWLLNNDWFEGTIPRKFAQHTGTQLRAISLEDEVAMAVRVAKSLQYEANFDPRNCVALVFVSPSFVPTALARKFLGDAYARKECVQRAALQCARQLGVSAARVVGVNWFCAGYTRALSILGRMLSQVSLTEDQFALIITASRISRITDYECKQTGPLFGDIATATLLAGIDSRRFPVHLGVIAANAEERESDGVFFDFHLRENVLSPTPDGGKTRAPQRLVFSLDGMAIADAAPRAMSAALDQALTMTGIRPEEVRLVVPHQAGTAIVRFTAMKLEAIGIHAETANGLTSRVGNLSSSSIPFALERLWDRLEGTIACPTAAVGNPGVPKILQGCLLLQANPRHEKLAKAA